MPKVKLGRDPGQEHTADIAKIIKHHMTDRDIATQTALAERTGIPPADPWTPDAPGRLGAG